MIVAIFKNQNKVNVDGIVLEVNLSSMLNNVSDVIWINDFGYEIANFIKTPIYSFSKYKNILDAWETERQQYSAEELESKRDQSMIDHFLEMKDKMKEWLESDEYQETIR